MPLSGHMSDRVLYFNPLLVFVLCIFLAVPGLALVPACGISWSFSLSFGLRNIFALAVIRYLMFNWL